MKTLKIKLASGAFQVEKSTEGAACYDIRSMEDHIVFAGQARVFLTGIVPEVPKGMAMMVYSRSGMGFKNGVRLGNCVGVIDSDYRGEIKVVLKNDSDKPYHVAPGDRIAQFMLIDVPDVDIEYVDQLSNTARGEGGFGSTGK